MEFLSILQSYGVKAVSFGVNLVRMVTHRDINDNDIDWTLKAVEKICLLKKRV